MLSLRAAEKLFTHGKSNTRAPKLTATSRVRSLEPVSTTIISSTRPDTDCRQAGRLSSSFFTIMQRDTRERSVLEWRGEGVPCAGLGVEIISRVSRLGTISL